jgi:hypothetical protein
MGVQMAPRSGVYLPHRNSGGGDTPGIVVSLLVTFYDGTAKFLRQVAQGSLKKRCLAGSGRADQIQNKNSLIFEQCAIKTGQTIVFAQNILFNSNGRPLACFRVMMVCMFAVVPVCMLVFAVVPVLVVMVMVMVVLMIG